MAQWREYWRNASQERPLTDMQCIVQMPQNALRMARYVKEDNSFYKITRKSETRYMDVVKWMPMPITIPEASYDNNADIPVECVYAKLYASYKVKCAEVAKLKKYIRTLHDMVAEGRTSTEIVNLLREYSKHRITCENIEKINEKINS